MALQTKLATLLVMACLAAPGLAAQAEHSPLTLSRREPDDAALAIGAILTGSAEDGASLPARLAALGSPAIPALFEARVRLEIPTRAARGEPITWLELGAEESAALQAALLLLPARDLCAFLRTVGEDERSCWIAIDLLGKVGAAREVELLVSLASPEARHTKIERGRRGEFQAALEGIFARHPEAIERVPLVYGRTDDALLPAIVWALGSKASEERIWALAQLLGRTDEGDPLILVELARLGREVPHPIASAVLAETRPALASRDIERVLLGIEVARCLEDLDAIPELIELLKGPSRSVSTKALECLRSLSEQGFGAEPKRWKDWSHRADEWRRTTAPKLLADVASAVPGRASHALMEFSKWRAFRHELSPGIAKGLAREEPELVVLTCAVLGHLGSWLAIPELAECLRDGDPSIRRGALLALRRITGRDLEANPAAWLALALRSSQSDLAPSR
jgi:hypothetical protein